MLEGKIAMVTGAARGIGRATALELARHGADVALLDLAPAEETRDEIVRTGRRAVMVRGDAGSRADDESFLAETLAAFGRVDILVNNCAHTLRKKLVDQAEPEVSRMWDVMLWGTFHCTQLAARQMVSQASGGAIVMVSSVLAHLPVPTSSIYNGAKAAINQMARTWAVELAPHRIRVNVVEPGWIDTPGERAFLTEEQIRERGKKLLFGRLGRPEEIARGILFLAAEEWSSYITGSCLRIDGGFTLAPPA